MKKQLVLTMVIFLLAALPMSSWSEMAKEEAGGGQTTMSLYPKTHIYIHNLLGDGLTVSYHPRSRYWDFALRLLQSGQTDELVFHPFLISALTNIRCEWSKQGGFAMTKLYDYSRDHKRCYKNCHWQVTPEGIYGLNKDGARDVFYPWALP